MGAHRVASEFRGEGSICAGVSGECAGGGEVPGEGGAGCAAERMRYGGGSGVLCAEHEGRARAFR